MARVTSRDFVITWIHSETRTDVVKTLGMTLAGVSARAKYLRDRGVKLPRNSNRKSETAKQIEIAQLDSLIEKELKRVA